MSKLSLWPEAPARTGRGGDDPRHAAYPVQQLARSRTHAFQLAFAHEAIARLGEPTDEVLYEPSYKGLRVLGLTETSLAWPAGAIARWYGGGVVIEPPRVRYQLGQVVQEPVMSLIVRVPRRFAVAVRKDLLRRGAEVVTIDFNPREATVRAQAAQAELLGYAAWLEAKTGGEGEVCMWLSHYAPLGHGPGPAAA